MKNSPFNFLVIKFVAGPDGDQHIFSESGTRSMCGLSANEISKDGHGNTNTAEYKERLPDRPVCLTCSKDWKAYPRSPWNAWQKAVAKGRKKRVRA